MISLTAGPARAAVLPEMGAGLAGLWVETRPVLRGWSGVATDGPFALAMNVLAPFSNRISGGFSLSGTKHHLAPNLSGEAFPIHGDAFQRAWAVVEQDKSAVTLILDHGDIGPFRYDARISYRLSRNALTVRLAVTSRSDGPLPFGLGFHPWFPRSSDTRLLFHATGYWPEDRCHLPSTTAPVSIPGNLNFSALGALPVEWINAGFAGWSGYARIEQGPEAVSVAIKADLSTAILFSPSAAADFFCFEPVSHPVDAHNLPGMPGLTFLVSGDTVSAEMTLDWT